MINGLDFTKSPDGLIPVIVQDAQTRNVLMLGFMNADAVARTIELKKVTFYSRSKKRLWTKGEESGYFLHLVDMKADCDNDTLLVKVSPEGPVCHTGTDTCWGERNQDDNFAATLEKVITDRKENPTVNSYTSSLFEKGMNKIAQKVGEEAVELVIEAMDDNEINFKNEAADLFFHYLILLKAKGFSFADIGKILEDRHASKITE